MAPYKLTLEHIKIGLKAIEGMGLEQVIEMGNSELEEVRTWRLVAASITRTFDYMVTEKLQYGCVCIGEATIFLQVLDDPTTVYYWLSVPKEHVGRAAAWDPDLNPKLENSVHLTAVRQMLAFTLRAIKTPLKSWA